MRLLDLDPSTRNAWIDLVRATGTDLSMDPRWFSATATASNLQDSAYAFLLHDSVRLVAVVPYVVRQDSVFGLTLRTLECPGSLLVAYHPSIITSIEPDNVLAAYLDSVSGNGDVIVLPNLGEASQCVQSAEAIAHKLRFRFVSRPGHESPYLRINQSWEDFVAEKPKKFRYKVRNALTDLEREGHVENKWVTDSADIEKLLEVIISIENHSWKADAGMAIRDQEKEHRYYRLLLPFLAAEKALLANILCLNSDPIAYSLCYKSGSSIRQLKTSFDQRHARLAPGTAAIKLAIERAFELGADEFDFLGDIMPHKMHWATGTRIHTSAYLYTHSVRGQAVGTIRQLTPKIRALLRHDRLGST